MSYVRVSYVSSFAVSEGLRGVPVLTSSKTFQVWSSLGKSQGRCPHHERNRCEVWDAGRAIHSSQSLLLQYPFRLYSLPNRAYDTCLFVLERVRLPGERK